MCDFTTINPDERRLLIHHLTRTEKDLGKLIAMLCSIRTDIAKGKLPIDFTRDECKLLAVVSAKESLRELATSQRPDCEDELTHIKDSTLLFLMSLQWEFLAQEKEDKKAGTDFDNPMEG